MCKRILAGGNSMIEFTDEQMESLLYGETSLEFDGVFINAWYDCEDGCKNIDLVWQTPRREVNFVANGMSVPELRRRIECELSVYSEVLGRL